MYGQALGWALEQIPVLDGGDGEGAGKICPEENANDGDKPLPSGWNTICLHTVDDVAHGQPLHSLVSHVTPRQLLVIYRCGKE